MGERANNNRVAYDNDDNDDNGHGDDADTDARRIATHFAVNESSDVNTGHYAPLVECACVCVCLRLRSTRHA